MRLQRMFRQSLAVALVASGCAARVPYNPFKVPQEDLRKKTKVVAMAPVTAPPDLESPEPVKAKFESFIEAQIREAGFTIVPSREYETIWKRMTEQLGGYFDPITGKRDESKFKTVRSHTLRELAGKFKADAVLHPSILAVRANFAAGYAAWHGTTESLMGSGLAAVFFAGSSHGTVGALSLIVVLEDVHGVDMYVNGGGIQILAKLSGQSFVPVPRRELFANEERNLAAVTIALAPLTGKALPGESSSTLAETPGER